MVLSNDSNHTKRIFIYLLYSKRSKKSGEGKYVLWRWFCWARVRLKGDYFIIEGTSY